MREASISRRADGGGGFRRGRGDVTTSLLFGLGSPAGIVNQSTAQAVLNTITATAAAALAWSLAERLARARLLARVDHAMLVQRRFVADAAHELRTPLTALSLQAERLQSADMSDSAKERLSTLRNGITRSQRLVVQLLTLARAQDQPVAALQPVSIQTVFRQVLEDTMPLAERKQIDIGVAGHADAMVLASEADLATLVKNLVGNAIRHTPVFGRIDLDVRVDSDTSVIQVSDTGPGIPPQERERVFEPFYRNLETGDSGSGLGLSIVKAIADRLGARIVLTFTDEALQTGLCVQVIVPKRQPRS